MREAEAPTTTPASGPAPVQHRRQRSRDAARSRRRRETELMYDLSRLLPLPRGAASHLDKASVIRLALSFMRLRSLLRPDTATSAQDMHLNAFYLRALHGFFMVLSEEGDMVYLSENVNRFLGLTQLALIGHSVFEFIHPCDEEEVKDLLLARQGFNVKQEAWAQREFFMRMKSTLVNGKRTSKSASWRVLHCTGQMRRCTVNSKHPSGDFPEPPMSFLLLICEPIPDPSNVQLLLDNKSFLSRHSLDMKFTYCDPRASELIGHRPRAILGHSTYEFYHSLDSDHMTKAHQTLLSKGQVISPQYRFLAKNGGYIWLETQATTIYSGDHLKPESIVCINFVLSAVEDEELVLSLDQSRNLQEPAEDSEETPDLSPQQENLTAPGESAHGCVDIIISMDFKDRLDSSAFHFTRKLSESGEESLPPEDFCSPALCKLLAPIFDHSEERAPGSSLEVETQPQKKAVVKPVPSGAATPGSSSCEAESPEHDLEMLAPYISMEDDFQLSSFEPPGEGVESLVCPDVTEPSKGFNTRGNAPVLAKMLTDTEDERPAACSSSQPSESLGAAANPAVSSGAADPSGVEAFSPSKQPLVFGGPAFTLRVEQALREIFQPQDLLGNGVGTGQGSATPEGARLGPTDRMDAGATESESSQCTLPDDRSVGQKGFQGDQPLPLRSLKRKHSQELGNLTELDILGVAEILVTGKRVRNVGPADPLTPAPLTLTLHLLGTEGSVPPHLALADGGIDATLLDSRPLQATLDQVS
ncbi:hypoxia-inducible factor 3-alpha-like [Rhinoraja longicauda]